MGSSQNHIHITSLLQKCSCGEGGKESLALDPLLVVTFVFLASTIAVALGYYRRMRRASEAYEEAKSVVGDIVISFDKQLQRQEQELETVAHKVGVQAVKTDTLSKRLDEEEGRLTTRLADLTSKAAGLSDLENVKGDIEALKTQLKDLAEAQEKLKEQTLPLSDSQIETAIPIRRERALAPMTETELRVLEFIAFAGGKTAPEVKEMIKLTREHTARLMKKLYQEGYLERRSEKAPYAYRVKEEMVEILKKREVKVP